MVIRFAFAGFRHGHIYDLLAAVRENPQLQLAGACEEDAPTRHALAAEGKVRITHDDFDRMLRQVDCDVIAIGDCYGKRGPLGIRALQAGRHVIWDKPVCTRLEELDQIERLAAQKGLVLGCMLDLRGHAAVQGAKKFLDSGALGQVHTVSFSGQHPLLYGRRPPWYFQEGCHGGTINDIFIHAADALEWLTGRRIVEVVAARAWNAGFAAAPKFQVGAQLMLRLDNDGGVLGDVSYLTPDSFAYRVPQYWRFTLHGSRGLAETSVTSEGVLVHAEGAAAAESLPPAPNRSGGYFEDFLREVLRLPPACAFSLTTAGVLSSARGALLAQRAADENLRDVPC
jgi:predicted dehydrogenase